VTGFATVFLLVMYKHQNQLVCKIVKHTFGKYVYFIVLYPFPFLYPVASEPHHSSISAGLLRTVVTISAPCFGGEMYIALAISCRCEDIFMASCALPFPSTTVRHPIRSPASSSSFINQFTINLLRGMFPHQAPISLKQPSKYTCMLTLLICIWEVPDSNISQNNDCPDRSSVVFLSPFK
jgi:hypothetical protein